MREWVDSLTPSTETDQDAVWAFVEDHLLAKDAELREGDVPPPRSLDQILFGVAQYLVGAGLAVACLGAAVSAAGWGGVIALGLGGAVLVLVPRSGPLRRLVTGFAVATLGLVLAICAVELFTRVLL